MWKKHLWSQSHMERHLQISDRTDETTAVLHVSIKTCQRVNVLMLHIKGQHADMQNTTCYMLNSSMFNSFRNVFQNINFKNV